MHVVSFSSASIKCLLAADLFNTKTITMWLLSQLSLFMGNQGVNYVCRSAPTPPAHPPTNSQPELSTDKE